MEHQKMDAIVQRLDRLERENRRWRVVGIITVTVLGLVVLMGATGSKVVDEIRARKFILVDKNGKTRGKLLVAPGGMSTLSINDESNKGGIVLGVTTDGSSVLGLYDKNWKIRASLVLETGGSPGLDLYDKNGIMRVTLGMEDDNISPSLRLNGNLGFSQAVLFLSANGGAGLAFSDKDEKGRIMLSLREDGSAGLRFHDKNEHARAMMGTKQNGSAVIVLTNIDGKVIWSTP